MTNTKEEKKTYNGHRDRVRALIHKNGICAFPPYQVLEYLLFGVIPYKDTKSIANDLLKTFGNFANVLSADINDLSRVKGMTYNAALFLHTLPDVLKVYQKSQIEQKSVLDTKTILPYLKSLFNECFDVEEVFLVCFDGKRRLLHADRLDRGNDSEVAPDYKTIMEIILRHNAQSVLLVHNHPSQNPYPSRADADATNALKKFLSTIDIVFLDHVIIGGADYAYSFAQNSRLSISDGKYPILDVELSVD